MLEDIEESRSLWLFELGEQHKGLRIGDDAVLRKVSSEEE